MLNFRGIRFKKIQTADRIYLQSGYFSDRYWLFKQNWIAGMQSRPTMQLRNVLKKQQLKLVTERMQGKEDSKDHVIVGEVLDTLIGELPEFREVTLDKENFKTIRGFKNGKFSARTVVGFQIGGSKGPTIDVEFGLALNFDSQAKIMIRDNKSPVLIVKENEILGAIAPLCPESLNKKTSKGSRK